MNISIGQLHVDGTVRYVTTSDYNNSRISSILQNFYSKESRVAALIELGNLVTVRPTPYGNSIGYDDKVHCRAEIRDDKEKKGKHLPKYSTETEFLKLEGHKFLYKDGKWHSVYRGELTTELHINLSDVSAPTLKGLEYYILDNKGELSSIYGRDVKLWSDLVGIANEKQAPLFVFRNNKLITTINHPLNQ